MANTVVIANDDLLHSLEQNAELHARRLLAGHRDVRVTSARRSPERNRAVGGVPGSLHLQGRAIDVVGPRGTLEHLARAARAPSERSPGGGAVEVLMESDHLHIAW